MTYGYIRISTDKQETINQRYQIEGFCAKSGITVDHWVEETISSKVELEKRLLHGLLNKMAKGDLMIACELSRLGRNLMQIMSILHGCLNKDVQVWTIKDNYRLGNDITSKVLAFAFGLSAEIERNLISQRTKEALQRKKSEGAKLGRPVGHIGKKKLDDHKEEIQRLVSKGVSHSAIGRILNCHRLTVTTFCLENGLKNPPLNREFKPRADVSTAPAMYEGGKTIGEIAEYFNISGASINQELKRAGVYDEIVQINTQRRIDHPAKNKLT